MKHVASVAVSFPRGGRAAAAAAAAGVLNIATPESRPSHGRAATAPPPHRPPPAPEPKPRQRFVSHC